MITIAKLYHNKADLASLRDYLNFHKADLTTPYLVKIITSNLSPDEAVETAKEIKSLLKNSTILGFSSSEVVVFRGKCFTHQTLVVLERYEHATVQLEQFSYAGKSPLTIATEVHDAFDGLDTVHLLFSNQTIDTDFFVQAFNTLTPMIKLVGGVAGDLIGTETEHKGFVFTEAGVLDQSILAYGLRSEEMHHFVGVSSSMESISEPYTITKTTDHFIEEIEGQPAIEWIWDYLELQQNGKASLEEWLQTVNIDYLIHFPLMIEGFSGSGRFTQYDSTANHFGLYHTAIAPGTTFRMGYINPLKTATESYALCDSILDTPVESLFAYICFFRKAFLADCMKWELMPFLEHNLCGACLMGEIAYNGERNSYYNGSLILTGTAESDRYLLPNLSALSDTSLLEESVSFVEKLKGMGHFCAKRSDLFRQLERFQLPSLQQGDLMDEFLGLPNIYQYELDKQQFGLDKLCLSEGQTADLMIPLVGQETYFAACREVLQKATLTMVEMGMDTKLRVYSFNYKTFLVAAGPELSEEEFLASTRFLFEAFEHASSQQTGLSSVSRFVVVLNQENALEVALNKLLETRESQDNFIVCEEAVVSTFSSAEETNVISLINTAIARNQITPFYQGIFDNTTRKIQKYEALMRIVEEDGTVRSPFVFLDIAKKYKFYNKISQMMIDRVLCEFEDRLDNVSINISLHDLQSEEFRLWLMERLSNFAHPERIIVEFVETESYQELDLLFDFVSELRRRNTKIAIDDFGSGYSTFSTIAALNPDFIKIDGSIIKHITTEPQNLVILNTIQYLSKQLQSQTIAEFVENAEIQGVLEEHGVSFSQGYLFAKPLPLAELPTVQ